MFRVASVVHGGWLVQRIAAKSAKTQLPKFPPTAFLAPPLLAAKVLPGQIWWFSAAPIAPQDGSVTYLRNLKNGAQLYLVGTAHVSAKSAEEVRKVCLTYTACWNEFSTLQAMICKLNGCFSIAGH